MLVLPKCVAAPIKLPVAAHELRVRVLPVAITLHQPLVAFDCALEAALHDVDPPEAIQHREVAGE